MSYELRKTLGNFSPWGRSLAADALVANSSLLLQGRSPPWVLDPSNYGRGALEPCSWGVRGDSGFGDGWMEQVRDPWLPSSCTTPCAAGSSRRGLPQPPLPASLSRDDLWRSSPATARFKCSRKLKNSLHPKQGTGCFHRSRSTGALTWPQQHSHRQLCGKRGRHREV